MTPTAIPAFAPAERPDELLDTGPTLITGRPDLEKAEEGEVDDGPGVGVDREVMSVAIAEALPRESVTELANVDTIVVSLAKVVSAVGLYDVNIISAPFRPLFPSLS